MNRIKTKLEPVDAREMMADGWKWDGTRKPGLIGQWVESMKGKRWFVCPLMSDVVECWVKD